MSTEDSSTPRAIIYARVAREQDSPEASEAQRAAVEAYAAARGCGKALDSAGEVCPACFRVHEPRPESKPAEPERTYGDYGSEEG